MPEQPGSRKEKHGKKDILSRVDHTLLSQTATWEEIRQILDDGINMDALLPVSRLVM